MGIRTWQWPAEARRVGPRSRILLGNGDGTFTATTPIILYNQRQGYFESVQLADVDGDGKLDIVAL